MWVRMVRKGKGMKGKDETLNHFGKLVAHFSVYIYNMVILMADIAYSNSLVGKLFDRWGHNGF